MAERVKNMQRQWIGKNNGTVITFDIVNPDKTDIQPLDVFTTRPDTLMGATYVSIAPEHDQLQALPAIPKCIRLPRLHSNIT